MIAASLAVGALSARAGADFPVRLALTAGQASIEFRAYGLGFMPIDGRFTRFRGTLAYDPADRSRCAIDLTIEVASLIMPSAEITEDVLAPHFLDAAAYPVLAYHGFCGDASIEGELTMHGVTRPLALGAFWKDRQITAEGRLHRADWGVAARPFLAGPTIRILVSTRLPR